MKTTTILTSLLTASSLFALACGDNNSNTPQDAPKKPIDAKPIDAAIDAPPAPPAPPALGTQIDRVGRPAINTAVNRTFEAPSAPQGAAKDAYNHDSNQAGWITNTTYQAAFATSLAILDGLYGVCGDAPAVSSPPSATSYASEIGLLADDEIYVDTAQGACNLFLAVELRQALQVAAAPGCGGRAPSYDVIDASYSALTGGLLAFDSATLQPKVHDGVSAHTDTSDTTFPFLGAPH
jgi:hypothetical protein